MRDIVDGGCFAGHDLETGFHYPIENLLSDFDRYGVAQGLVGSYRCLYQDIEEGNREASQWAAQFPERIIPLAILHPAYYGQSPDKLLRWLKYHLGFRVVALFSFPSYYPVEWDSPSIRLIGEAAAQLGMALQAGVRSEFELAGVVRAWGDLPVTVMIRWMAGHRYKTLASEAALAARYPNFVFDVGNLSSTGAIEYAVKRIGAERLFFASNTPHNIVSCPHAALHSAKLTPSERKIISSETLRKTLALEHSVANSRVSFYETEAWQSFCMRPKVDIHWHPDHWNLGEPGLSESDQIATFEYYGYERVIMSAILALNYSLESGNALTESWCEKDPRIYGMIVINPLHLEESLAQINQYADHPRFVGLKTIQDLFGIGLDDTSYEPILNKAAERNLPVLAHIPGMDEAARRHPEINFIATHSNWCRGIRFIDQANVSFEFSTGHALRHETQLARFIQTVSPERVLYGSDGQLCSPAWSLSKLIEAASRSEEELILRGNAYRVFPKLGKGLE